MKEIVEEWFMLNSRHMKTKKSFARADQERMIKLQSLKLFVNNKRIFGIIAMKWKFYLSKQDFSKRLEQKKKLFSFGNGPWRFTLASHRSCISLLSSFNIENRWKLHSGEFLRLLEQFTATMKQPYFFWNVYMYLSWVYNDHNTNFQPDFDMTFSAFPHNAS